MNNETLILIRYPQLDKNITIIDLPMVSRSMELSDSLVQEHTTKSLPIVVVVPSSSSSNIFSALTMFSSSSSVSAVAEAGFLVGKGIKRCSLINCSEQDKTRVIADQI